MCSCVFYFNLPPTTVVYGVSLGMSLCCTWALNSSKHVFSTIINFQVLYCFIHFLNQWPIVLLHNQRKFCVWCWQKNFSSNQVTVVIKRTFDTNDQGLDNNSRAKLFAFTFTCLQLLSLVRLLCIRTLMYCLCKRRELKNITGFH